MFAKFRDGLWWPHTRLNAHNSQPVVVKILSTSEFFTSPIRSNARGKSVIRFAIIFSKKNVCGEGWEGTVFRNSIVLFYGGSFQVTSFSLLFNLGRMKCILISRGEGWSFISFKLSVGNFFRYFRFILGSLYMELWVFEQFGNLRIVYY